jgi:hypothetical protein
MINFEYVFSLLVILLGLGLAEIFGGLARAVKARPPVRIGWGTGLLATWTVIRTVLFWRLAWRTRDVLPESSAVFIAGVLICGLYYLAGALVFPDSLEGRTSLDEYFAQEKGKAIGALLAAMTLAYLLRPAVLGWTSWSYMRLPDWFALVMIFGVGSLAMLTRSRRVAVGSLGVLVACDIGISLGRSLFA